jgi:hypothetical protein
MLQINDISEVLQPSNEEQNRVVLNNTNICFFSK